MHHFLKIGIFEITIQNLEFIAIIINCIEDIKKKTSLKHSYPMTTNWEIFISFGIFFHPYFDKLGDLHQGKQSYFGNNLRQTKSLSVIVRTVKKR